MGAQTTDSPSRRLCFFPANRNCWDEYLTITYELQSRGLAEPVILADVSIEEKGADLSQAGDLLLHRMPPLQEEEAPGIVERSLRKFGGPSAVLPFARGRYRKKLSARKSDFDAALDEIRPDTVVLSNGRTSMQDLPLIKACKERGVRTVAFPLALPAYGASLVARRKKEYFKGKYYPDLMRKHPGQYRTNQCGGELVSYYPAHIIAELDARAILPPNPWVVGAGLCDAVLLAGEKEKDLLIDDGADPGSLNVTGLRAHDLLDKLLDRKERLRNELSKKYDPGLCGALDRNRASMHGNWLI